MKLISCNFDSKLIQISFVEATLSYFHLFIPVHYLAGKPLQQESQKLAIG
jgi:hypothetical protein